MMDYFKNTILTISFSLFANLIAAQLTITEISYNPPESGTDTLEYIEFMNTSGSTLDLTGYKIMDGIIYDFDGSLEAGQYLVVCKSAPAMKEIFGIDAKQWADGSLNNNGEILTVINTNGDTIDFVNFDDVNGWPNEAAGTDGAGASIELCDILSDNNLASSWKTSKKSTGRLINDLVLYGSPGMENQCEIKLAATVFSNFDKTFSPKNITIFVGETVRWQNIGGRHNVNGFVEKYPNNPSGFGFVEPSDTMWIYDYTFTKPGLYDYVCDPHELDNMVGTVLVQLADFTSSTTRIPLVDEVFAIPNPTSGFIQIQSPSALKMALIYNSGGQLMDKVTPESNSLDLSLLPQGLYFIHTVSNTGISVTKVIKE